jgi:RHS repeat-associated protein
VSAVTTNIDDLHEEYKQLSGGDAHEKRNYIYAGGRPVAVFSIDYETGSTSTLYLHTDNLGSIEVITDSAGNTVDHVRYDAWGKRRNTDGSVLTSPVLEDISGRGFTGHKHVDVDVNDIGLIDMKGRLYDPEIAMFQSVDPFGEAYWYVYNNPLRYIDPYGLQGYDTTMYAGEDCDCNDGESSYASWNSGYYSTSNVVGNNLLLFGIDFGVQMIEDAYTKQDGTDPHKYESKPIILQGNIKPSPSYVITTSEIPQLGPDRRATWRPGVAEKNRLFYQNQYKINQHIKDLKELDPVCFGGPGMEIGAVPALYEGLKQGALMGIQATILTNLPKLIYPIKSYQKYSTMTAGQFKGLNLGYYHNTLRGQAYRNYQLQMSLGRNSFMMKSKPFIGIPFKAMDINSFYNTIQEQ